MESDYSPLEPLKDGDDKISRCSDDVICKILALVTPTKYAIRTSVLAKRWERLWAFTSNYNFEHKEGSDESIISFTNSVDNLLFLRDCFHMNLFKLSFIGNYNSFCMRPGSWVCAVVMCNISELDLDIDWVDSDLGELPWSLFTCKTLVVLKLSGKFILNPPHHVCLPNVKTLLLKDIIYVGDAAIHTLLLGCPVLEDLTILRFGCDPIWILMVKVPSLRRLKLVSLTEPTNVNEERVYRHQILVDSPNLEFIELVDEWPNDIILMALPKIVEARLRIEFGVSYSISVEYKNKMGMLLENIAYVRHLFLDEDIFEFLSIVPELLPIFCKLVSLELKYRSQKRLMWYLHCSPKIEALSFSQGFKYSRNPSQHDDDVHDLIYNEFELGDFGIVPQCLLHSLKVVEIKCFRGKKVELNIVKYLLKHAMVLEKVTFLCARGVGTVELQKDLTNYPRLSPDCQLHVIPHPRG